MIRFRVTKSEHSESETDRIRANLNHEAALPGVVSLVGGRQPTLISRQDRFAERARRKDAFN